MKHDRILVVVDMQKDFIDGALGTAEAQAITPAAAEKIRAWRAAGWPVAATMDTHGEDYLSSAEGKKLPVIHCVKGTPGWELDERIREALTCLAVPLLLTLCMMALASGTYNPFIYFRF